ncbi:MAG: hypothetical protein M1839_009020 [Geoglossum umbratile]|nr:MAG: hypothetical protein M1839_009020 [Geoglossum umbratile]
MIHTELLRHSIRATEEAPMGTSRHTHRQPALMISLRHNITPHLLVETHTKRAATAILPTNNTLRALVTGHQRDQALMRILDIRVNLDRKGVRGD